MRRKRPQARKLKGWLYMKQSSKINAMLLWLAAYEAAHELRTEAEAINSAEQQAAIEPLFAEAFPDVVAKGTTYAESWKLDIEDEIQEWEEKSGISDICDKILNKHKERIDGLLKSEKEAEINLCNAALDVLEVDAKRRLTPDQMRAMRERVNTRGWSYERQKMRDYILEFAAKARKSSAAVTA